MDGVRRLLRSLEGLFPAFAEPRAAFAGGAAYAGAPYRAAPAKDRRNARPRVDWTGRLVRIARLPGLGLGLTLTFFACVGLFGAVQGGGYESFVKENGRPRDIAARALGFGVEAVTIAGQIELSPPQILAAAGVDPRQSLLFLDVDDMRRRLMALPLIKKAYVRKLYPGHLAIEVIERQPFGLWQKDGNVAIIAADGAAIDALRDEKFARLPFVVGEGANQRIEEYASLLEASGDLRGKIRAGILVSQRRWTLKMTSGVEVLLPEIDPKSALERLSRLEADNHILEKDIVSLDLRVPGKTYLRLTEEAAAAREAARSARKGAHS
jgi:cell division protein FtsQ